MPHPRQSDDAINMLASTSLQVLYMSLSVVKRLTRRSTLPRSGTSVPPSTATIAVNPQLIATDRFSRNVAAGLNSP
jgi:hypothetical protein